MLKKTVKDLVDFKIFKKNYIDIKTATEIEKSNMIPDINGKYYIANHLNLSMDEIKISLKIRDIKELKAIKHTVVFFVILIIVVILLSLYF